MALAGLAGALCGAQSAAAFPTTSYVLVGENGRRVARLVTAEPHCPDMLLDGRRAAMAARAEPRVVAQRPTISEPLDSKPSAFDGLVCEALIPPDVRTASVAGRNLPLPPATIRRIVVIGDTGCRLKIIDKAFQDCNDSNAYPFAQVAAAAAAWKPDLVVHVGDFLYRENACPEGHPGCAGSVWGYGADSWRADFFAPAEPLLTTAPLALARGNHESCERGGQGWWRYLDPHALAAGRDCDDPAYDTIGDFTEPYAVPLGSNAQLIFFDSSATPGKALAADDIRAARYREAYARIEHLATAVPHSILVNHHPMLAFAAKEHESGRIGISPGNAGLQSVFGTFSARMAPPGVDLLLSGHVHLWEAVGFASDHPGQIVAGFSGTQEDVVPLPATLPPDAAPAPGAEVKSFSSWLYGFGFLTLERSGDDRWQMQVHDRAGKVVDTCRIAGKDISCDIAQVAQGR